MHLYKPEENNCNYLLQMTKKLVLGIQKLIQRAFQESNDLWCLGGFQGSHGFSGHAGLGSHGYGHALYAGSHGFRSADI